MRPEFTLNPVLVAVITELTQALVFVIQPDIVVLEWQSTIFMESFEGSSFFSF